MKEEQDVYTMTPIVSGESGVMRGQKGHGPVSSAKEPQLFRQHSQRMAAEQSVTYQYGKEQVKKWFEAKMKASVKTVDPVGEKLEVPLYLMK